VSAPLVRIRGAGGDLRCCPAPQGSHQSALCQIRAQVARRVPGNSGCLPGNLRHRLSPGNTSVRVPLRISNSTAPSVSGSSYHGLTRPSRRGDGMVARRCGGVVPRCAGDSRPPTCAPVAHDGRRHEPARRRARVSGDVGGYQLRRWSNSKAGVDCVRLVLTLLINVAAPLCRDVNGRFHRFQWPLPAPRNVGCGSMAASRPRQWNGR